jgi:hypothetical protein
MQPLTHHAVRRPPPTHRVAIRLIARPIAGGNMMGADQPMGSKQGRRESNSQPPVLETGALPIELHPYVAYAALARGESTRWNPRRRVDHDYVTRGSS